MYNAFDTDILLFAYQSSHLECSEFEYFVVGLFTAHRSENSFLEWFDAYRSKL